MEGIEFVKGHGTENDFVLLPDHHGTLGAPAPDLVRQLCDRRAGIGGDGVIRVVRTSACEDSFAVAARGEADWFMDYYNSDGSLSQMCGNGARVFGRYLIEHAGLTGHSGTQIPIATRDGVKTLEVVGDEISVDLGVPHIGVSTWVGVGHRQWPARAVDIGNPHAVAFVDDVREAGALVTSPHYDHEVFGEGVNVEFVERSGGQHVTMRVFERGSGETRSCGTGAGAVMAAAAWADGAGPGSTYIVDVPGGRLQVTWTHQERLVLTGPAVLVARGYWVAGR